MQLAESRYGWLSAQPGYVTCKNDGDKVGSWQMGWPSKILIHASCDKSSLLCSRQHCCAHIYVYELLLRSSSLSAPVLSLRSTFIGIRVSQTIASPVKCRASTSRFFLATTLSLAVSQPMSSFIVTVTGMDDDHSLLSRRNLSIGHARVARSAEHFSESFPWQGRAHSFLVS